MTDNTTVAKLEERLDNQIARVARGQVITLAISVILILVMVIYFSIMGSKVRDLMQPESVSEIAVGYIEDRLPGMRQALVREIEQNTDRYLEAGVNELKRTIPDGRVEAEDFLSSKVAELILELDVQLDEIADYAIELHAERIREMVAALDSDAEARALEEELYEMFMEPIRDANVQMELMAYSTALQELSERMSRLASREHLTRVEQVEADLLIALKELSSR